MYGAATFVKLPESITLLLHSPFAFSPVLSQLRLSVVRPAARLKLPVNLDPPGTFPAHVIVPPGDAVTVMQLGGSFGSVATADPEADDGVADPGRARAGQREVGRREVELRIAADWTELDLADDRIREAAATAVVRMDEGGAARCRCCPHNS